MLPSETMIWQPEFTDKTLSRKTGAVQLDWQNRIKFTLDHNFSLTSVKFADELLDQNSDIDSEDVAQRLDADFFLLTSEISCLVDALVNALGGEAKQ